MFVVMVFTPQGFSYFQVIYFEIARLLSLPTHNDVLIVPFLRVLVLDFREDVTVFKAGEEDFSVTRIAIDNFRQDTKYSGRRNLDTPERRVRRLEGLTLVSK